MRIVEPYTKMVGIGVRPEKASGLHTVLVDLNAAKPLE